MDYLQLLTSGCLDAIVCRRQLVMQPIVQVVAIGTVMIEGVPVYNLELNDGKFKARAMIPTWTVKQEITKFAIIKLDEYEVPENCRDPIRLKRFCVISNMPNHEYRHAGYLELHENRYANEATELDEPANATEIFKFVRRTRERIANIRGNYPIFWKHMGQHLEETKQQRQIQIELRERQNRRRMRGCPAAGFRIDQPVSLENFAKLMAKKCHF